MVEQQDVKDFISKYQPKEAKAGTPFVATDSDASDKDMTDTNGKPLKEGQTYFATKDEDGDTVKISLNDIPFGEIVLSNSGAKLTIPLKKGDATKITCLASADGGGGVTFRAISSTGELRTRVMALGESESWTISFK